MGANVQALKNLYVALGGDLTDTYSSIADGIAVSDYNLTCDVINAIAEIAVPAELPKVTSTDNGKVLTVVEGEWDAATLPSSSET